MRGDKYYKKRGVNVERLLRNTNIPTHPNDLRRLDLIVPGLHVARELPLFCDVTVVNPISRNGEPRSGTSNQSGKLREKTELQNNRNYPEVNDSGLGHLLCLGAEVYGRWSGQCVKLVPQLARAHVQGMHHRIRRGKALGLQHRWWGILSVGLQSAVARAILRPVGDMPTTQLETPPAFAELEVGQR